jgi:hypothetical protein
MTLARVRVCSIVALCLILEPRSIRSMLSGCPIRSRSNGRRLNAVHGFLLRRRGDCGGSWMASLFNVAALLNRSGRRKAADAIDDFDAR